MDPHVKTECSACGSPASNKCAGCLTHVYCDKICQKHNWKAHKVACKTTQEEKIIKRAADVLKDIFLAFREATFDSAVRKVKMNKNGELEVWDGELEEKRKGWFQGFPNDLVDAETKNGVLAAWVCTELLAFLKPITDKLFSECRFQMHEMDVNLGSPPRFIVCYKADGTVMKNWPNYTHSFLRLTSPHTKRQWVIDMAGDQYGIAQPFWNWVQYQLKFGATPNHAYEHGAYRRLVRAWSTIEGYPKITFELGFKAADHLCSVVASWEDTRGVKLCDLLKVPDEVFAEHRRALVERVKEAMLQHVANTDSSRALKAASRYERFNRGVSTQKVKDMSDATFWHTSK